MNSACTPEKVNLPDSDVEWYDLGAGCTVCPTVKPNETDGPYMAALSCIKSGLYYFKVFTGTFTKEDLPSMLEEYAPAFKEEVEAIAKSKTQEQTQ